MKARKRKEVTLTTQRVDYDSIYTIKTLDRHIFKTKGFRVSQWEIIKYAIKYVMEKEADFIDYVEAGKIEENETTLDTLIRATSKPWFPYGNLAKVD